MMYDLLRCARGVEKTLVFSCSLVSKCFFLASAEGPRETTKQLCRYVCTQISSRQYW